MPRTQVADPARRPVRSRRPDPAADRRRQVAIRGGRVGLALVSAVVLGASFLGWSTVQKVTSGLHTADVIDPAAKDTSGPQNILLVGIDTRTDAQGNPLPQNVLNELHAGASSDGADATDTIIIIHVPAGGGRAIGISIPRDSYVQLAGGYGMHKINSAYTYAETAAEKRLFDQGERGPKLAVDAAAAGAHNSIDTIEQFTGLQINHFASVNLVGFYDISEAIGGVQLCLKQATRDPDSGANFPAGVQTLEGAKALAFVRQRHNLPDGDLDRIKRQQAFMAAMAHKILSTGVLTNATDLNNLIGAIQKSITLDQGWDILNFAQQMQSLSAGAIQFATIPIVSITYPTESDGDAVEVDPQQVQSFIASEINSVDNAPASTTGNKPAAPTAPAQHNSAITTEVYNATGIPRLAGDVLASLTSQGFTSGGTGNAQTRSSTVIDYAPGQQAQAQQVATALGGGITTASDSLLQSGTVRVYLGTNYSGPKGTAASPATTTPAPPKPSITSNQLNCVY